jgi:hypothetical protein
MGRKPLLKILANEITIQNSRKNKWLLSYRFTGSRSNPHFFNKIQELTNNLHQEGAFVDKTQTSVLITNDLHGAVTAAKLAKHYGAEIKLFKVKELDPTTTLDPDYEFILNKEEVNIVVKAVYSELKKQNIKFTSNNNIDQLGAFLMVTEYLLRPNLPIKKEGLIWILEQTQYLEENMKEDSGTEASFVLELDNVVPVMKAVETYLMEHIDDSTEDNDTLFNVLKRLTGCEDDPFEPSRRDIEELLKKRPVDTLIESILNARIIHEIF